MRVLSFTNCALDPATGSGKTVWSYSEGLKARGHEVEVCEPARFMLAKGSRRGQKFRQALGAWKTVQELLKQRSFDVIEFYGDEFWLATWRLSKLKKRPLLVAHTNGLELLRHERSRMQAGNNRGLKNKLHGWFARQTHERFSKLAFSSADAFAALCESDCAHVIKLGLYPKNKVALVPPGLDEEYLGLPFDGTPKPMRLAFTGSWIARKGADVVAQVAISLMKRHGELKFDVFGASGSRDTILATFPEELRSRVTVHPRLSNGELAQRLSECRVFLFPTRYEGFGIATAEAMACGNAVITTPTGYGADLKDGEDAVICNFDDVSSMETAAERLLTDDALWASISINGWKRANQLHWNRAIDILESNYLNWLH